MGNLKLFTVGKTVNLLIYECSLVPRRPPMVSVAALGRPVVMRECKVESRKVLFCYGIFWCTCKSEQLEVQFLCFAVGE